MAARVGMCGGDAGKDQAGGDGLGRGSRERVVIGPGLNLIVRQPARLWALIIFEVDVGSGRCGE